MWIKPAIVVLFVLLVMALLSGGVFLFKDQGAPGRRRTLWSLGIRAGLAVLLIAVIAYGTLTGQLRSRAPWARPAAVPAAAPAAVPAPAQPEAAPATD